VHLVHDLCGLAPALESLDENEIILEKAKKLLGVAPEADVPIIFVRNDRWRHPAVLAIRKCFEDDLYAYLRGDLGLDVKAGMLYALAAQFTWYLFDARLSHTEHAEIVRGPSELLREQGRVWLGSATVGDTITASWHYLPSVFYRACSRSGRLLILWACDSILLIVPADSPEGVKVSLSATVFLLVDPEIPDANAVSSVWREACLLQGGTV
jgi:hypothetical protein